MAWRTLSLSTFTPPLLAILFLDSTAALAQPASPAAHARIPERQRALERQLAASEARAQELQRRIEQLERRLETVAATQSQGPGAAAAQPAMNRNAPPMPAAATTNATTAPVPRTVAAAGPAPATRTASSRPGSFEVDEDAAQRALERTLTERGALLLPQGAYTVTPSLGFARNEQDSAQIVDITNSATGATGPGLVNSALRRNEFTARVDLRAGLPWESQLEVGLPYQYVRSSRRDPFGSDFRDTGSGLGDVTLGLAKTLTHEKGAIPDLIGRVTLNTGTGRRSDGQVALEGGYRALSAELVALKRQDPLAFFAGASYSHVFERDNVRPGAVANLTLGTVLAASPATSLQFGFTQTYRRKQEANGATLPGSDQTYGTLNIGAASVVSRDMMLLVSTSVGLGSDAPKYGFNVSLPITFR